MITRAIIKNYKSIEQLEVDFSSDLNIIVGDNETGKSTVLEAVNLALTGQLNRRSASYELHPFLFNKGVTEGYIAALRDGETVTAPKIEIELYFADNDDLADFKGTNNSKNENVPGVSFKIQLDQNFAEEYSTCIAQPERMTMVPVEFYMIEWKGFHGSNINLRQMPLHSVLIDPGAISNTYAANRYVLEIARDYLSATQQANLALSYRKMRDAFSEDTSVEEINTQLEAETGVVTDKKLSVALDMSAKTSWETTVQPHLDGIPLSQAGKGEQNAIKIKLAIKANQDRHVVLIEEPENHLSHTNLSKLIHHIESRAEGRQLIIATHSSFVLNKLGIQHTLMFNGENIVRLNDLPEDTYDYFMKLPGHDTLRMVLARRTILVEGPSDELVVQRAYKQTHGKAPLEDGVEVISVNSLAFKRFLDIARLLDLDVSVMTDNDGNVDKVTRKYEDYSGIEKIHICYSDDISLPTLEPQILDVNGLEKMNRILDKEFASDDDMKAYMSSNKTSVALRLLASEEAIEIPDYIQNAIN